MDRDPKIYEKARGHNFKNHPENINRKGRKKKIYTILKEKGFGGEDIKIAFGELAFYSMKELESVKNDESKPIIARIIAKQFYEALNKSDWYKIKEILEHVIGKPQQNVDIKTDGEKLNQQETKVVFVNARKNK